MPAAPAEATEAPVGHDDDGALSDYLAGLGLPPRIVGAVHVHAAAAHAGSLDQLLAMMHNDPEEYEQMLDGMVEHVEAGTGEQDDEPEDDDGDEGEPDDDQDEGEDEPADDEETE